MTAGQHGATLAIDGAWALWLAIWIVLSRRVKGVERQESLLSRASHIVPLIVAGFLLAFSTPDGATLVETPLVPRAWWMVHLGLAVVLAGLAFAVWARLILAGNWSGTVTLKRDHELIRRGPYALVRHPIYTGLITALLGTAIAIDEIRAALAVVIVTVSFVTKMRTEEAFMRAAFGGAYDDYRRSVPALVPGWRR